MRSQRNAWTGKKLVFNSKSLFFILFIALLSSFVMAQPTGLEISGNVTDTAASVAPDSRADDGGTITTLVVDVLQQNPRWKAYVGNLTGVLTLDDSSGQSIFRWEVGAEEMTGEVYISRSNTVSWGDIACSNETMVETEDTFLGFTGTAVDSVNGTFNETTHPTINVGLIPLDNCRSTSTFVNSTQQSQASADFPLVLLQDTSNLVYVSPLNQGSQSYNNESIVDFQAIVPDEVGGTTTYYFYAEIGS